VNQKSPIDLSEFERPVPEPTELYVKEWPLSFANGALHASMRRAGKDAPDPSSDAACAGDDANKPNASAIVATFADFETLIISPLLMWLALFANREKVLNPTKLLGIYWIT
jgi:hypothetical protein